MYPNRTRFARWRIALGASAALGLVALACEVPSPEMLAPNGKTEAAQRLYGKVEAATGSGGIFDLRKTVALYFPAIARGEGGPSILFVVKSAEGSVVLTETQPARDLTRTPAREKPGPGSSATRRVGELHDVTIPAGEPRVKIRQKGAFAIPTGVGVLQPDDIATIDVSKHAAGTVAPNAVSIISIVLKPGAAVPLMARSRNGVTGQ